MVQLDLTISLFLAVLHLICALLFLKYVDRVRRLRLEMTFLVEFENSKRISFFSHSIPLDKIRVTIGATDLMSDTELYPHEDRKIDKVINHPHYNTYTLDYDLALLK